jgi:hypothetical protein
MLFRHIEQSWECDPDVLLAEPVVKFLNLLCVARLVGY